MYQTPLQDDTTLGKAAQNKASVKVALGFAGGVISRVIVALAGRDNTAIAILGGGLALASLVFWFVGFCQYVKAKGYSPVLGAVGILGCIGLIVILVLPDKSQQV